jgi:hypothetical protein
VLGLYSFGTRPVGALPRARGGIVLAVLATAGAGAMASPSIVKTNSVLNAAGVGAPAFGAKSTTFSQMTCVGTAAFAPAMLAQIRAAASFAGSSAFASTNSPGGTARFAGIGQFSAVSYAVYIDAERACVHQELRTASVTSEGKTAIVPAEDRVLHVAAEPRGTDGQPRKRIC